jgi:hypothetical protein
MALSEGVQAKLDQEGITPENTAEWLPGALLAMDGASTKTNDQIDLTDPDTMEVVMLYRLTEALQVGARMDQLDELGLKQVDVRRKFWRAIGLFE